MKLYLYVFITGLLLATPVMKVVASESSISESSISENDVISDPFEGSVSGNDISSDSFDDSISQNDSSSVSDFYDFSSVFDSLTSIDSSLSSLENDISLLSDYSGITSAIPELYLSYMRDILSWSILGDHYVSFSSSYVLYNNTYTYYVLVVGDLSFSGSSFSGSDVDVYEFFPQVTSFSGNSNYRHSIQSTFSYRPGSYLCFTDLSSNYPNIRGTTNRYLFIIIVIMSFIILFYTLTKFGWGNAAIRRRSQRKHIF